MLHARRRRLAALEAKEAAGESFWTSAFDESVRRRLLLAAVDASGDYLSAAYFIAARKSILRDEGLFFLTQPGINEQADISNYLLQAPDDMVPTVLEALSQAFSDQRINSQSGNYYAGRLFDASANEVLREHRISYELIEHRMVEFSSRELHVEVVAPVLTLLAGKVGWHAVEASYQDALSEISKGSPGDAITDAGTALQEALTVLGCDGNALGPLIKSAKNKGLLAPHDSPLLDAVEKTLSWVSADRSQTGDAHNASTASVADAWFTVHVVGAVILRLSRETPRI